MSEYYSDKALCIGLCMPVMLRASNQLEFQRIVMVALEVTYTTSMIAIEPGKEAS